MFNIFEKEYLGCMAARMEEIFKNDEFYVYKANEEGQQRVFTIDYNLATMDISCSCKLFQSIGILCRHALKIFYLHHFMNLPQRYLLKMWTKEAKK